MILVRLMGGLGNQMFQYAAARRLAWKHRTTVKLDLSFLEGCQAGNTTRKFELHHLCIDAERASDEDVARMTGGGESLLEATCSRIAGVVGLPRRRQGIRYSERHFHFDPALLELPDGCYLEGYWQSERYFADIGDIVRREFAVKSPLSGKNGALAALMQTDNSVFIHIRRGDYVASPSINAFHGTCPIGYYRDAVAKMEASVADPSYFVFSDDPEWVKDNLRLSRPMTVVEHNGVDAGYEDLRLMGFCRHSIIANSSLSWWGAWLSMAPDKIVIAPRRWFNDPAVNTEDLYLAGWLRL